MKFSFNLVNSNTGKIVWSYTVANEKGRCIWLYYWGGDIKDYVPVMKECMNEAISNLNETIKHNPDLLNE